MRILKGALRAGSDQPAGIRAAKSENAMAAAAITFLLLIAALLPGSAVYADGSSRDQYMGRLIIPGQRIDVCVYRCRTDDGGREAQKITDREDSAAIFGFHGALYVADHNYQSFQRLHEVKEGDTLVLLMPDGKRQYYECVFSGPGTNNGRIIPDRPDIPLNTEENLICYTCLKERGRVHITMWDVKI